MGMFIRKYRHYTAAALLLTFLLYIGNIYLFTHTHDLNGVKVSHSHIYSGTQDAPNHSHTAQQFNVIALLSTFNSDELVVSQNSKAVLMLIEIINQQVICNDAQGFIHFQSLRAPPVMV